MRLLFVSCLVATSLTIGGCGLRPLYANGSQGAVAQVLADVDVAPIEGHSGWLVRNALRDRLGAAGAESPRYRLDVRLDDQLEGLGVLSDEFDELPGRHHAQLVPALLRGLGDSAPRVQAAAAVAAAAVCPPLQREVRRGCSAPSLVGNSW